MTIPLAVYIIVGVAILLGAILIYRDQTFGSEDDSTLVDQAASRRDKPLECVNYNWLIGGKEDDHYTQFCPPENRIGTACVMHTPLISTMCDQRGLNKENPDEKCYRANNGYIGPDGLLRSFIGLANGMNDVEAYKRMLDAHMDRGQYYEYPGWCEYDEADKKAWVASSLYEP